MAMKKSTQTNSIGMNSPSQNPNNSQRSLRNNFESHHSKKAILKSTLAEIEASIKNI